MKSIRSSALILLFIASCANRQAEPTTLSETGSAIAIHTMVSNRASHCATLLPNGKVLITGGFDANGHTLSSAELFDPDTRTFTTTGSMNVPRLSHTATLLPSGKVLISGGLNGDWLASAELYDPTTGKFTLTGQMTGSRSDHVALLLDNGKVLHAGGVGAGYLFLSGAEVFDPADRKSVV